MSSPIYPAIPDPIQTPESILDAVLALKQAVELLNGARLGDGSARAVTATDLSYVFGTPVPVGQTPPPPSNPTYDAAIETARVAVQVALSELREIINTSTVELENSQQQALSEFQQLLDDEVNDRTDADALIQAQVEAIILTNNEGAIAAIATETGLRIAGDTALAGQITSLSATVDGNSAAISNEAIARSSGDASLATDISTVTAIASRERVFVQSTPPTAVDIGDIWIDLANGNLLKVWDGGAWVARDDARIAINIAGIATEQIARADADTAISNLITTLTASVAGNTANISNEAITRATADTAIGVQISGLTASVGSNAAAITTEQGVRASADTALSGQITTLTAQVNNNAAAIVTEQGVRASGDSALTFSLNTLTTTVNGHTASISTHQTSLNGLFARYGVTLNVNGHISGFQINSLAGSPSQFIVEADEFRIASQTGALASPFVIVSNVAYIAGARIQDGSIVALALAANSVTASKIAANSVTAVAIAADAVTTPKILGGAVSDEVVFEFADNLDLTPAGPAYVALFSMSGLVNLYDVASLAQITAEFVCTGFDAFGTRISADYRYRFKLQTRETLAGAWIDRTDTNWMGVHSGGGVNTAIGHSVTLTYSVNDITDIMARVVYQSFSSSPGSSTLRIYNPRIVISGRLR